MTNLDNTITYRRALNIIAKLEDFTTSKQLVNLNSFDRSLILAILFNQDKGECLDDIIEIRKMAITKLQEFELNKPKVWNCGHTEDEHCFADVMFCVRDPNWYENYKKEN